LRPLAALAAVAALALPAHAATPKIDPALHDQALEILKKGVSFRTVKGAGNVPAYAAYLKGVLVQAGYADSEITITLWNDTAFLLARYPGTDPKLKPLVILGHMDVVEARREDWQRDPFTPVIENGFIYGRGATDNKFDVSMAVATLANLRREGWKPRREVILALSGDEETAQTTAAEMAKRLKDAELVLNVDGGGGALRNGRPVGYGIQGAEKTYADFQLTVTDPGGHSSRPTATNAIYRLAHALARIEAYRFPVMSNEVTRGQLAATAPSAPGPLGEAMKRFAANPTDTAAAATIYADADYGPMLHTTCVATMLEGGHATNALPQKAQAVVNCRIFPGTPSESVRQELLRVAAEPGLTIARMADGAIDAPASALRPDVMAAVTKAVRARYADVPITPSMDYGASDSMFFRAAGIPAYGVSGMFTEPGTSFIHGLNEKAPLATLDGDLVHYDVLFKELAK
jgi:carboxypeptidase PM20D1